MSNYLLRDIDPELWERVKERAKRDEMPLRSLILALLKGYADEKIHVRATRQS